MSTYPMISIELATEIALSHASVLDHETVSLQEARGRVLAANVLAPDNHPAFRASVKDGYAVIASDGAGEFEVVGESRAGEKDPITVTSGKVAYITTGAPVPEGADSVIQIEDVIRLPAPEASSTDGGAVPLPAASQVRILKAAKQGQDIRAIGSDIAEGQVVLAAGETVGTAEVGLLATVGAVSLSVYRRPRVAVLSTGDEVVEPSVQHLAPGQVRDSNRAMLLAAAAQAGAVVTDLGVARDQMGQLEGCLDRAIAQGMDILITSGGVSMGDRDLLKPLLERRGVIHFGRVLMKPGKPLTFATLEVGDSGRKMLVFGLPGNPVSSCVCFQLVVVPCLHKMSGWKQSGLRRVHARLASSLRLDPERPEYHRATLVWCSKNPAAPTSSSDPSSADASPALPAAAGETGFGFELWALSTGNQISSRLLSARSANAILEIPRAAGTLAAGSVVSALLIDDLQMMPIQGLVPATLGF
ncbi:MAG: hypothetical protein WDW38_000543 [Sanguina aurantia]